MARLPKPPAADRAVEAFTHDAASRRNIPTAELQSLAQQAEESEPVGPAHYPRARPLAPGETRPRDADRDPQVIWNGMRIRLTPSQRLQLQDTGEVTLGDAQLTWRGKDTQDWSDLVVQPPPIYVQEKVHPKAIIADLRRQAAQRRQATSNTGPDLFAEFNGLPDPEARLEFYQHEQHWSNRMILGDSLQVMASLAEREGLRGRVQCIYFDPPYGIKFNSNWQVSTQSRDVKDGKREDISREPEQVKAFRDTWKDGIHSYLTYLRDRLTVARELLTESGSIFVQIGDENVHRVRAVMDEVFGEENFTAQINFKTADPLGQKGLPKAYSYIVWYAKNKDQSKFRKILKEKNFSGDTEYKFYNIKPGPQGIATISDENANIETKKIFRRRGAWSAGYTDSCTFNFELFGKIAVTKSGKSWATTKSGIETLKKADRLFRIQDNVYFKRVVSDNEVAELDNNWDDKPGAGGEVYVVQTATKFVARCILMTTDPGDLVLDPTCGSGTTATVAEQWGRRWITIDTSRVALALARTRLMAAKYPYYLLADSREGRAMEQKLAGKPAPDGPVHADLRQGFVYDRAPHVTLKSIANNAEIDVLWETAQATLEPLRAALNAELGRTDGSADARPWEEWQVPREPAPDWSDEARRLHSAWWQARIARQAAIDASIAKRADVELLYDRPYEDKSRVRVAGPFTVESLSPHRVVPAMDKELVHELDAAGGARAQQGPHDAAPATDFGAMVLDHLRTSGVQQTRKADSIRFTTLVPGPAASSQPRAATPRAPRLKAGQGRAARLRPTPRPPASSAAPASSSAPSSAPSLAPTWSPPPGRPPTPASTSSSPAPSTTTPTRPN